MWSWIPPQDFVVVVFWWGKIVKLSILNRNSALLLMQWRCDAPEIPYSRWPFLSLVPQGKHTDPVLAYWFPFSFAHVPITYIPFLYWSHCGTLSCNLWGLIFSQNNLSSNTLHAVLINSECVSFTVLSCRNWCILVTQEIAACILRAGWNINGSWSWLPTIPRNWWARRTGGQNECHSIFPKSLGKANPES